MLRKFAVTVSFLLALVVGPVAMGNGDSAIAGIAYYPEGLYWDGETHSLFYAEMTRNRVMRVANGQVKPFVVERDCGPTAIGRAGASMVIACHLGGYLLVTDAHGAPQVRLRVDENGRPLHDPNDVASDGTGVYISDSGYFEPSAPATGAVYYWRPGKELHRVAHGLRYANGLVVDRVRRRLFVSEHLARRILTFPLDGQGRLGRPSIFADLADIVSSSDPLTGPDGLDLGADGRLYAAIYGAARVIVFDPAGRAIGYFERPERYVTTVALDGDNRLFVAGAFDNQTWPYIGHVVQVPNASMQPVQR